MTMTRILAGLSALLLAPAATSFAQSPQDPIKRSDVEARVKEHFAKADANRDGIVVWEEVAAQRAEHRGERADAHFSAMDKDGNGSISRAEFDAAHAAKADQSGARRGDAGKPGRAMGGRHAGGHDGMKGGGLMFHRADADRDGKLTLAEALVPALERFDRADANKDGTLSAEERKAAREARRGMRRERRG